MCHQYRNVTENSSRLSSEIGTEKIFDTFSESDLTEMIKNYSEIINNLSIDYEDGQEEPGFYDSG